MSALHAAAIVGHVSVIKQLMEAGPCRGGLSSHLHG